MTRPLAIERLSAGRLAAGRAARRWSSRMLASPLLNWRYGAAVADRVTVQPQDLRVCDRAIAAEVAAGFLRLDSAVVPVDRSRPFDQPHLSDAQQAELHGFGWLRHLKDVGTGDAQANARRLIVAWLDDYRSWGADHVAWRIDVVAQRMTSWLSVADFIAVGTDDGSVDRLLDAVAMARIQLAAHWRSAHVGLPRVRVATALALFDTVVEGRDAECDRSYARLNRVLTAQTTSDGAMASRNAGDTVEMAFDVANLHAARLARGLPHDDQLSRAIDAAVASLRHTRLGDGTLARFNGVPNGAVVPAVLIARPERAAPAMTIARPAISAGYARLERGQTIIVTDVAPPPPLGAADAACAGCLSFELSIGRTRVLGRAGAAWSPGGAADWTQRSTAAHTTLTLAGHSSGRRVSVGAARDGRGASVDSYEIVGPQTVAIEIAPMLEGDAVIRADHDGFVASHGLVHTRQITLSAAGDTITGTDRLAGREGTLRLRQDAPFAIYFHLAPGVDATVTAAASTADISWSEAGDFHVWRFSATGPVSLAIEPSPAHGGSRHVSLVLRGTTFGQTDVGWTLQRADAGQSSIDGRDATVAAPVYPASSEHP